MKIINSKLINMGQTIINRKGGGNKKKKKRRGSEMETKRLTAGELSKES